MKKVWLIVLLCFTVCFSFTACSLDGENEEIDYYEDEEIIDTYDIPTDEDRKYDIVLLTDSSGISSESNLELWKSIIAYGDTNSKSYKYYAKGVDGTTEQMINEAVKHDAKIIIVTDSGDLQTVVGLNEIYHNTNFLVLNTHNEEIIIGENIHCVEFKEEQSGYLAGYLTVMDGYKTLGFIGNGDNDSNRRYLYGMVQGADKAADDLRIHDVNLSYSFIEDDIKEASSMSKQFYDSGVEVIFTCTENISKGAAQSAKSANAKIICGEKIYDGTQDTTLGYIRNNYIKAVDYSIENGFDSDLIWLGTEESNDYCLGLETECLEMVTDKSLWKFNNITEADYKDVKSKIISGEYTIADSSVDIPPIAVVVYSEF